MGRACMWTWSHAVDSGTCEVRAMERLRSSLSPLGRLSAGDDTKCNSALPQPVQPGEQMGTQGVSSDCCDCCTDKDTDPATCKDGNPHIIENARCDSFGMKYTCVTATPADNSAVSSIGAAALTPIVYTAVVR